MNGMNVVAALIEFGGLGGEDLIPALTSHCKWSDWLKGEIHSFQKLQSAAMGKPCKGCGQPHEDARELGAITPDHLGELYQTDWLPFFRRAIETLQALITTGQALCPDSACETSHDIKWFGFASEDEVQAMLDKVEGVMASIDEN